MVTPSELAEYLRVLRAARVIAARLDGLGEVSFGIDPEPDPAAPSGQIPTPGGWKSPAHLDNPDLLWPRDPGPGPRPVDPDEVS